MPSTKTFRLGCSIWTLGVLTGILFCLSLIFKSIVFAQIFGLNNIRQLVIIDPTTGIQTPVSNAITATGISPSAAIDYNTHQYYLSTDYGGTTHITSINTQTGQVFISPAISSGILDLAFDPGISPMEQANQYTDGRIAINNTYSLPNPQATGTNSLAIGPGSTSRRADTLSVGTLGRERTISNVAPGVEPTDAVNVSQLDHKINQLESKLSRGIAAMAALSNITPYVAGATAVNTGSAYYNRKIGVGLTASHWSTNGLWNFNAGVAYAGDVNSTVMRVGIGFLFK